MTASADSAESSTFRDPQGRLIVGKESIRREIYPEHAEQVRAWLSSPVAHRWMAAGRLVSTEIESSSSTGALSLKHERIFFPSYPWEWSPIQWHSAAALTLDLCSEAIDEGLILKDATPLNILFSGPHPVFVDVLSFEPRDPETPVWLAYAQFVRTFLLPLAAWRFLGWPLAASLHRRDGYEPADLTPWLPLLRRWRHPLRSLVALPLLLSGESLQKRAGAGRRLPRISPDAATWTLQRTLRNCRNQLAALVTEPRSSRWSDYSDTAHHYAADAHRAKQEFVRRTLEDTHPVAVLDVGANTGVYSRIAAACGARVVAWDTDMQACDANARIARSNDLPVLSLVADFARPTPPTGWQNRETLGLLARAEGRFDCVLMLGILHHLLLADQIPLDAVLDQVASISRRHAILEWIPREDSQFQSISRGRESLYSHLDEGFFRICLEAHFTVRSSERLSNGRSLWLVEKHA